MMLLSVVIPTFNRAKLLQQTLPALLTQVVEPWFDYEIIFVSNGSKDETFSMLTALATEHPRRIRVFEIAPTGGPSAPRNHGIRLAKGQVLIIQDDDVMPEATMVREHARYHRANPADESAALGEVYVPPALLSDPMSLFHSFPYDEVRSLETLSYLHFWTCNVSLKRNFMMAEGMFDESFLFYEDVICAYHLQQHGMQLRFLPSARGQHLHELKPAQIAQKGQFYGRWLFDFFASYPRPEVQLRFEIVSRHCGLTSYLSSLVRRCRFRLIDNPVTWWCLRKAGALSGQRSRLSDFYYGYELRRNIFTGYDSRSAIKKQRR